MLDTDKQKTIKTAVEWLEERLNLSIGYELKPLRGFFVIAKEMEHKQIEEAIADGYAGCCGKKATVKLKGNFWERKESWDERKSVNEIIVNSKNKPELKVKCLHCGRKFIGKLHHKCNTGYRKRNHNWEEI